MTDRKSVREKYMNVNVNNFDVDLEEFLIMKGIEFISKDDWVQMSCPFPDHNDSNPSFYIHKEHLGFNCYVCGSGNWSEFLERMGWSLEEFSDINVNKVSKNLWNDFKKRLRDGNAKELQPFPMPYGLRKVKTNSSDKYYKYLTGRSITNLLKHFDFYYIGYTKEKDPYYNSAYYSRILVPCHDSVGKFIWFEGRSILDKTAMKYYRPKGVNKSDFLFNLHRVKKKGYNWVIVVEGIIDAMILWSWGFPAVCCFGSDISDNQLALLMLFDKVYITLDNDAAGIKGWVKIKDKLDQTGIDVKRILLPRNKDINDITVDDFIGRYNKSD